MKHLKFLVLFIFVVVGVRSVSSQVENSSLRSSGYDSWSVKLTEKIVGGEAARPGQIPYQVALYHRITGFLCGGSLVIVHGRQLVLSAAQCVRNDPSPASYFVTMGELRRNQMPGLGQKRSLTRILIHEDYVARKHWNDIALFAINHPFTINPFVAPIRLARPLFSSLGRQALVSGWGRQNETGRPAPVLQKARIPILDDSICRDVYKSYDASTMICAGSHRGACKGDTGGPLATIASGRDLGGIFSTGRTNCTQQRFPGVYTKVSAYFYWIQWRGLQLLD